MRSPAALLVFALSLVACARGRGEAPPAYAPYPGAYGAPPYGPPGGAAYPPTSPAGPASFADPGVVAAEFARSRLGYAYCWGGNGPTCYDCSGLTHAAWRQAGKTIPRTSESQLEGLRAISFAELRPGDIVWRPGHVGLYVGGGWVIHAPGTGKPIAYQEVSRFQKAVRP